MPSATRFVDPIYTLRCRGQFHRGARDAGALCGTLGRLPNNSPEVFTNSLPIQLDVCEFPWIISIYCVPGGQRKECSTFPLSTGSSAISRVPHNPRWNSPSPPLPFDPFFLSASITSCPGSSQNHAINYTFRACSGTSRAGHRVVLLPMVRACSPTSTFLLTCARLISRNSTSTIP